MHPTIDSPNFIDQANRRSDWSLAAKLHCNRLEHTDVAFQQDCTRFFSCVRLHTSSVDFERCE